MAVLVLVPFFFFCFFFGEFHTVCVPHSMKLNDKKFLFSLLDVVCHVVSLF